MTRDRDIRLGEIEGVSVEEGRGRGPAAPPPRGPAPKPRPPAKAAPAAGHGGGAWMLATLVLAVVVIVLGAWFFRELQVMRGRLDVQLDESQQRLGNLASQLSATDESLNQSSGKVSDRLAFHESEIRKLWDVSNKRNKEAIQKNEAAVGRLEKHRAELGKLVAGLQTEVETLKQQNQQYRVQRNQMQTQLDLSTETVKQLETRMTVQRKIIDQLDQLMPRLQSLAAAEAKGKGVGTRLAEMEAAIAAIDGWRREVNTRLDRMQGINP